jgi:hypothetical protein
MAQSSTARFENIESAHAYVGLLQEAVDDTAQLIEQEIASPAEFTGGRHLDALRLVHYKLHSLQEHLTASRRLLGDLRTLRRYLLDERASVHAVVEASHDHANVEGSAETRAEQV